MKALIFVNPTKQGAEECLASVKRILERNNCACDVAYGAADASARLPEGCDFCAVLGGDGTMLAAAGWASRTGTPLLGVDLGRLGYMSEISIDELDLLSNVFSGEAYTEDRMMLDASVLRGGEERARYTVLNEIVVSRGAVTRLIDLELSCSGEKVGSYRADGLIVSTPTGSTAYSMSAGGPIIDPSLELMTASAVCPHGISFSGSMVFSPDSVLEISVSSKYHGDIFLTADGRESTELFYEDSVRVSRSNSVTKLLRLRSNSFYKILAQKFKEKY
jgi:NAD+ kinase